MEIRLDVQEDYEAMCMLLGPLDYPTFYQGYIDYERWKRWSMLLAPPQRQPEVELEQAS